VFLLSDIKIFEKSPDRLIDELKDTKCYTEGLMPLHIDYRPVQLTEFFGNKTTVESLNSVLSRDDKPHTFLFAGPTGTGKTTLARIVRDRLECAEVDYEEYNAANTRGIDTMRNIIVRSRYLPIGGPTRVFLLDEAHAITSSGAEALLKILEDPPEHVYFLLCTTQLQKIIPTIRNRSSIFETKLLKRPEISSLLNWVLESEGFNNDEWKKTTQQIITVAEGCPRQALVILDQVIDIEDEQLRIDHIVASAAPQVMIKDLCKALLEERGKEGPNWSRVIKILKNLDEDPERIRRAVLGYFSNVLLRGNNPKAAGIMNEFSESFYDTGRQKLILACYVAIFS